MQERTGREPERFAKPIDLKRLWFVSTVLRQASPGLQGNEKRSRFGGSRLSLLTMRIMTGAYDLTRCTSQRVFLCKKMHTGGSPGAMGEPGITDTGRAGRGYLYESDQLYHRARI